MRLVIGVFLTSVIHSAPMEVFLRRTTHVLVVTTWIGAAYLIGLWLVPAGVAFFTVGAALFYRALRRGAFHLERPASADLTPVNTEREAKYMVTQVLRNLTLIQVAYLCQDFQNRRQSRAWLKKSLPRTFRSNLDEMHSNLEMARMGTQTKGLKLALQIYRNRQLLMDMEDELEIARKSYPDYVMAHPVIYVITEYLDINENTEPEVVTLAGWDPTQPTLLPAVDRVALLSEVEGQKRARGHAALDGVRRALAQSFEVLSSEDDVGILFAVQPVGDPVQLGVKLDQVPLGFVVGVAEML